MDDASTTASVPTLDSLHRDLRSLRRKFGAVVIVMSGVVFLGQNPVSMQQESVGFTLLDADGRARGVFAMTDAGEPTLRLLAADSTVGVALTLRTNGEPELVLFDSMGRERVLLGVERSGALLRFLAEGGTVRTTVGLGDDGSAGLVVNAPDGRRRGFLTALPAGGAGLLLRDGRGAAVFSAP